MAERACSHTTGIICDGVTKCAKCGWFPKEGERRLRRVYNGDLTTGENGIRYLSLKKKGGGTSEQ